MRQSARSRSLCLECKAVGWMRARLCCGRVDPRGLEVRNERSGSGDVRHWRQPDVLVSLASCAIANVACRHLVTLSGRRSEEHTSELRSPMRNTYAVFCLKKKPNTDM